LCDLKTTLSLCRSSRKDLFLRLEVTTRSVHWRPDPASTRDGSKIFGTEVLTPELRFALAQEQRVDFSFVLSLGLGFL
jgi:hypothetical protein